MLGTTKRSYQTWSLEEDYKLYCYAKRAKANRQPLTKLFEQISEEFGRRPQTIAQHYYAEIRPKEEEFEKMAGTVDVGSKPSSSDDSAGESIGFPKEGAIVEGTVENIVPFGVFVRLDNELKGLLHISRISRDFIEDLHDLFHIGQRIKVKVDSIDENGRLAFSTIDLDYAKVDPPKKRPLVSEKTWQSAENTAPTSCSQMDIITSYCDLVDELRRFQIKVIDLKHLLELYPHQDQLNLRVKQFIDRCLEL